MSFKMCMNSSHVHPVVTEIGLTQKQTQIIRINDIVLKIAGHVYLSPISIYKLSQV